MNRLDTKLRDVGHEAEQAAPEKEGRYERSREQPADLARRLPAKDEPGTYAHDAKVGVLGLDGIEPPLDLDLGLVPHVEARADAVPRPRLVDASLTGPGRVDTDR